MTDPDIRRRLFGLMPDGREVHEYTLDNGLGLRLSALTLGGIVNALHAPDRRGDNAANLVLALDSVDDYLQRSPFYGIIVGRYANRIAGGRFELDGQTHELVRNDGPNCLHGGAEGFGTRLWSAEPDAQGLTLRYSSPHGEQGFPGRLDVSVRYSLAADEPAWRIDYEARCDRPTLVNLSHHDYFNLAGQGDVKRHRLMLAASRYHEVDADLIPSAIAPVAGTPFDFRAATEIGARLQAPHPQLERGQGYDHNWLLDHPFDGRAHLAARLEEPDSGRVMELFSSEPAIQFYGGQQLKGAPHARHAGLCLEPQHSPDSPHHAESADWPSTVLRPGEVYRSRSLYRFGIL